MICLFLGFTMLFFHIIDDYYLQGVLANLKQKTWWEKNVPKEEYKNDYRMALFMHGFSWSFMIHLPLIIFQFIHGELFSSNSFLAFIVISIAVNNLIHSLIDNAKANKFKLNLIQDQLLHLFQIILVVVMFAILF
jgi:hypothetical protein